MVAILLFSLFALTAFTRLVKKHDLEQQGRLCISGYVWHEWECIRTRLAKGLQVGALIS